MSRSNDLRAPRKKTPSVREVRIVRTPNGEQTAVDGLDIGFARGKPASKTVYMRGKDVLT
jgi:hypothetical protein